jgi:glucose/arabinose dehydrogenase
VPIYNESRGVDFIPGAKISSQEGNRIEDFGGKGKYSPPEFTWNQTAGPTAIKFLETDSYGKEYKNDLLVADINNEYLYHFNLNKDRTGLSLPEPLKDKIANNLDELKGVVLGDHFGVITDMDIGPDGYLYILSHHKNNAEIFKIMLK